MKVGKQFKLKDVKPGKIYGMIQPHKESKPACKNYYKW